MDRRTRLAKLLTLQQRLKELHEARHANHLKEAAAAAEEAASLLGSLDASDGLGHLFPELYHERIGRALARQEANLAKAAEEAARTAAANARTNLVERAHREVVQQHERSTEEKAILEMLEQRQHAQSTGNDGG
jgi:hypothetical protein